VEIDGGGQKLIFDLGTGARPLGAAMGPTPLVATVFLSHYHWDHIQGLPFCGPAFNPASKLTIYGATREGRGVRELLNGQMVSPYFPVSMEAMRAQFAFRGIASGEQVEVGPIKVRARELDHPNGVLGYRVELDGKVVVYATDTEHGPDSDVALADLARGADCLIYDAMYTTAEYQGKGGPPRKGWGHSTWEAGAAICRTVGIKKLVLFHHEPKRTDPEMDALLAEARSGFADTVAAREGESLSF
jgi:phosphoribosyl 1,2-cyclic phosphodiesterase